MKTKLLIIAFALLAHLGYSQSTVTNVGSTFSPANLTITVGTAVTFNIGGSHNAIEVSQATYNANGTTSNGGFNIGFGGGTTPAFTTPGVYYYVCTNHVGGGMKGTITVNSTTGVNDKMNTVAFLEVNPNPVNAVSAIKFSLNTQAEVEVVIFNSLGIKRMDLGKSMYSSGEHTVNFDAVTLEDGLYTATILVNGESAASKKIIIKK